MRRSIIIRWPGGKLKALTLSYDDAQRHDERMVGILDKHGIKCTFNLNNRDNTDDFYIRPEEYNTLYKNHEVAVHGKDHVFMKHTPLGALVNEIIENRLAIERATGRIVQGMAYPYGPFDEKSVEVLKSCGIKYSRTTPKTYKFDLPKDWYGWEATCHHQDENLFELCDNFLALKEPAESWVRLDARLFCMWGHSYEFHRNNNWERLEEFCEKMGGQDDIWYATNMEIYDYVQAFNSLEFNTRLTKVYNPASKDMWFNADCEPILVKAGETIEF